MPTSDLRQPFSKLLTAMPIYGRGNKAFDRSGFEWKWYFNKWLVKGVYLHGSR